MTQAVPCSMVVWNLIATYSLSASLLIMYGRKLGSNVVRAVKV